MSSEAQALSDSDHVASPRGGGSSRVGEMEAALGRVVAVQAARLVVGPGGRITEIHVLASRERGPKQVVRDVQSVLLAGFGVEVDYRAVSVVQLAEPIRSVLADDVPDSNALSAESVRISLVSVASESAGNRANVEVVLAAQGDDAECVGRASGPSTAGLRLVPLAVVDAVSRKLDESTVDIEYAEVVATGKSHVAIAILRLLTSRGDHIISGSAIIRKDANDAMARATLSALNRFL